MVKVYFETEVHAELVAIFDSEETYDACLDALEKLRKKHSPGLQALTGEVEVKDTLQAPRRSQEE